MDDLPFNIDHFYPPERQAEVTHLVREFVQDNELSPKDSLYASMVLEMMVERYVSAMKERN